MIHNVFKYCVSAFCLLWIAKEIVMPVGVGLYAYKPYMALVEKCDSAMNSSWYISQLNNPNLNKTELIQMLDCHEYDSLRKVMLIAGLSEDFLAYLGLKALEIHQRPADELAEQHRFISR